MTDGELINPKDKFLKFSSSGEDLLCNYRRFNDFVFHNPSDFIRLYT